MNYKKVETKKANSVKLLDSSLFFCYENIIYDANDFAVAENCECQSFWKKDNILHYHNNQGQYCMVNLDSEGSKFNVNFSPFLDTLSEEKFLFGSFNFKFIGSKMTWEIGYFDLFKNKMILNCHDLSNFSILSIQNGNSIVTDYSKVIALYDLEKQGFTWIIDFERQEIEVSHLKSLKKVICDTKIFLCIACHENTILKIDKDEGEIVHQWRTLKEPLHAIEYSDLIPNPEYFTYDVLSEKIIGIFHRYYFEIDIHTDQIEHFDLKKEMDLKQITSLVETSLN